MIELVLPFPPSVNQYYAVVHGRKVLSAKGRQYREAVASLALENHWPRMGSVPLEVRIEAWMPDKRRRDLDNILKAALDSLTHAGVYADDSQIDKLSIERAPSVGGMLKIRFEAIEALEAT